MSCFSFRKGKPIARWGRKAVGLISSDSQAAECFSVTFFLIQDIAEKNIEDKKDYLSRLNP